MFGYVGKMLFVDLSNRTTEVRELTEETARLFMGGPSLGAKILFEEMPANTDVFAPESVIGFVGGPLNNANGFFGGRYTVVSKSPVTNGFNDANSGGTFAARMRQSGYDAIFFKGIADKPVYLMVNNGEASIVDADDLWGKTSLETQNLLEEKLGTNKFGAAYIGPAGERKSHMAAVMNDIHRTAARGGPGAVMGSKNLKAVVVMGNQKIDVYDRERVVELGKKIVEYMTDGPAKDTAMATKIHGTGAFYAPFTEMGNCSIKNWRGIPDEVDKEKLNLASPVGMDDTYKKSDYGCSNCPMRCGALYDISKSEKTPSETLVSRPEYEIWGAFGSALLNFDGESTAYCNNLCNEYGFDSISAGMTVAWAMDCYNHGILTQDELDGIDLTWGNVDAIVALTKKMCTGEGVGAVLQNGSLAAAKHFGKGEERLAVASGIEVAMHNALISTGMARIYQYDPCPGRHMKGGYPMFTPIAPPYKGTGYIDSAGSSYRDFQNASGLCTFNTYCALPGYERDLVSAVTGWNLTRADELEIGKRSVHLRQAFNVREGLRRKDFWLSEVLYKSPKEFEGRSPLDGIDIDHEKLGENFFEAMGWDADMVPLKEALADIGGLDNVISELYPE